MPAPQDGIENRDKVFSTVSERIVALKKSKAGHLGELTKIYRRLDEYLIDQKFAIEVREDSHRLDNQCKRYSRGTQRLFSVEYLFGEATTV